MAEAALACPDRRLAVVLGAGLLDDVPLDILARTFDRVRLVDAVHPWPARLAMRRHRPVARLTAEISAGLCEPAFAQAVEGASLVVSANVLSQPAILPVDAFARAGRAAPPALGVTIIEAHLAALSALARRGARICLIADTVQREEDREGRILGTRDLRDGVPLPDSASAWDWELAPSAKRLGTGGRSIGSRPIPRGKAVASRRRGRDRPTHVLPLHGEHGDRTAHRAQACLPVKRNRLTLLK